MGIAFLLSREKRVAGSTPATRCGTSYTATIRGVSAGGALAVLLRFQMRAAFCPTTFALISLVAVGLAGLLPERVRLLLIVEPPAALGRRVERVELQPGDLVRLHEHLHPVQRLAEPLIGRQAAAEHDGPIRPALLDLRLLLDRDHVLAAVVLPEPEGVEDGDAGIAPLEDQLAEVLDGHVLGPVRKPHRLAEVIEELDEPHPPLARG